MTTKFPMEPADPRFRYVYAVFAFLETAGFSGLIFSWVSLVYLLKEEGLYSDLCHNETVNGSIGNGGDSLVATDQLVNETDGSARPCLAQDAMLNLVFSAASSVHCLALLPFGEINLKYGTRVTRLVATYPTEYYGYMFGIIMVACGAVDFLQTPLLTWATTAGFDLVHTLPLVVTASTFIHPLYQWWAVRTERPVPNGHIEPNQEVPLQNGNELHGYATFGSSSN